MEEEQIEGEEMEEEQIEEESYEEEEANYDVRQFKNYLNFLIFFNLSNRNICGTLQRNKKT